MFGKRHAIWFVTTAVTGFLLVLGVETTVRRFPRFMSTQWQIRHSEIQGGTEFKAIPDNEIGFLYPPSKGTDSHGFPNTEPWPERPAVAFLGDSLVSFAAGKEGTFTHLIARMLFNEPVVNLGLAGAGLERQYVIYSRFGHSLQPRLVVACLFLASDFDNDVAFQGWQREGRGTDYNRFRTDPARSQHRQAQYVAPLTLLKTLQFGRLLEKSWVYSSAKELMGGLSGGHRIPDRYRFADGTETALDSYKLEFAAASASMNDPRIEALLTSVEKLRELVAQAQAQLLIMLIPSKEELFGVPASAASLNVVARTRQRLQEAKLSVLDLYGAIRDGGSMQSPYFSWDIHLNAYGSRIVAEEFVAWFNAHRRDLGE